MDAEIYLSPHFRATQVPHQRMQVFWSARLLGEIFGRITHAIDLMTWVGAMQLQGRAAAIAETDL